MEEASHNDALIVGAGPAGLMTALLLLRYGIHSVKIIDKRPLRTQMGHAAGLQPRTQEILRTLGLEHAFELGAGGFADTAFWSETGDQGLSRSSVEPEVTNETPYKRLIVQHQGRTEELLNAEINKFGITVQRPFELLDYEYVKDDKKHPICAYVKDINRGQVDKYRCKYLIAADGASSYTRDLAGVGSSVHQTHDTWIVADAVVDTDFPDFRRRCAIRTKKGNLMLIPSRHNTVRIYLLLTNEQDIQDLDNSKFDGPRHSTTERDGHTTLLDVLNRRIPSIIEPYRMEISHVEWISKYIIAQRVIENFTDGKNVIFVGDACHSHSPKAAQGMNTGISDAYNLAWKLAHILHSRADTKLLGSYDLERRHIANQLIEFDTRWAGLFSNSSELDSPEFVDFWKANQGFTSGLDQEYPPNALVKTDVSVHAGQRDGLQPLSPGKRIVPMNLLRNIDGMEVTSLETMPANGEFYYIVFAGNILQEPRASEFRALYMSLVNDTSVLTSFNGNPPAHIDSAAGWAPSDVVMSSTHSPSSQKLINLYVVHTADHLKLDLMRDFATWKYNFFSDPDGVEHRRHSSDPANGMMKGVLVRPDQIIGFVSKADEFDQLKKFFKDAGYTAVDQALESS